MRYIFLFLTFFTLSCAQKVTIGAGPYIQTQPYENVDNILIASPVIFFDNGIVYIRWSRGGIYFLGEKNDDYAWGFSLSAQPRTYGYKASDSEILSGMSEKKTTWEGGLAFSATANDAYIEIMALTDMLNSYGSWILKTEIGYDMDFKYFSLYPSLIVVYQSNEFVDYYYGVKEAEATETREYYNPSSGFQLGAQTYIKYPFTDNFSALLNMRIDRISNEALDSPIVTDRYIYSGLLSLIYTFEY